MDNLEVGDIILVNHRDSKLSQVIAWFMKSRFSHTAIYIGQFLDKTMLLETSIFQVTISDLEKYENDSNCMFEIWRLKNKPEGFNELIIKNAYPLNGQTYGWLQLFSFALKILLARVKIYIKNLIRIGLVCDHVPLYSYKGTKCAIDLEDPENYHTQEVYEMIVNSNEFEMIHKKDYQ